MNQLRHIEASVTLYDLALEDIDRYCLKGFIRDQVTTHVMDRDVNAAYNLIEEGLRLEFVRENNIEQYKWIPLPS